MSPKLLGMMCIALASVIEACGQLAFKRAATKSGSHNTMTGIHALRRTPGWVGFGLLCFASEGILYTVSLRLLDLSLAFPAGSLTFVSVVLLSRVWLREAVGTRRWAGVGLIISGTILLGIS